MLKLESLESRCLLSATVVDSLLPPEPFQAEEAGQITLLDSPSSAPALDSDISLTEPAGLLSGVEILASGEAQGGLSIRDSEGHFISDTLTFEPIYITDTITHTKAEYLFTVYNSNAQDMELNTLTIDGEGFGIGKGIAQEVPITNGYVLHTGDSLRFRAVFDTTHAAANVYTGTLTINKGLAGERTVNLVSEVVTLTNYFTLSKSTPMSFTDADGDPVKLKLNEGSAKVYLNGNETDHADIAVIELSGTTDKSILTIANRGEVAVGSIITTDAGSLKSINAPKATLNDTLQVNGALTTLSLNNISEGATLTIGTSPTSKPMTIKANHIGVDADDDNMVDHVRFNLAGDVKSFTATDFLDTHNGNIIDNLIAASLGKLTIKTGNLEASVKTDNAIASVSVRQNITGNIKAGTTLGSVKASSGEIRGDVTAQIGSIKSVSARTDISGDIRAGIDLGSVKASSGAISGDILAATGSIKSVSARTDISGDIQSGIDLGTVKASTGLISGNLMAETGAIKSVSAAGDISGNVMALTSIGTVSSKATLDGVLRAESIKSIKALDLNNAIVSVSQSIGSVSIKRDVIDSHVLAGYDIKFSVNDLSDDSFSDGTIKSFKFGGLFDNSYVNAGTMTAASFTRLNSDTSSDYQPSGSEYSTQDGTLSQIGSVSGKTVDSGGFFSTGTIKTKLTDTGDFVVRENL